MWHQNKMSAWCLISLWVWVNFQSSDVKGIVNGVGHWPTLHSDWGEGNGCAGPVIPGTGPEDSPLGLDPSDRVSLCQRVNRCLQHETYVNVDVCYSLCMHPHQTQTERISPGLNRTIAFRQANSVGSTARTLKRSKTSPRQSRSAVGRLALGCSEGGRSGRERRGQLSMGMDHWIALSRNNSLQASSSRITWKQETIMGNVSRNLLRAQWYVLDPEHKTVKTMRLLNCVL